MEKEKAGARSGESHSPTTITFVNDSDVVIQAWWIDYDGKQVPYVRIQPGKKYHQHTFVSHPWIFRNLATKERMVVNKKLILYPEDKRTSTVYVQKPGILPWSPLSHHRFPEDFKEATKALLMCHQRANQRPPPLSLDGLDFEHHAPSTPRSPYSPYSPATTSCWDCLAGGTRIVRKSPKKITPIADEDFEVLQLGQRLSDLPAELLLPIIQHCAPSVDDIEPVENDIVE